MKIIPLSIPTPFYIGDVNVYLIKDDPLTMIDVGPKTSEAFEALRAGLRKNGVALSDTKRVVLTHAHEDHCGLAKRVREETDGAAEIYIHEWETQYLSGRLSGAHHYELMMRAGVPVSVFEQMQEAYKEISLLTDALEPGEINFLSDEMDIEFASGTLRVLHTPGHTPGSCCFLREANRTLIAGDTVLKRVTPNPVIAPDFFDGEKRFKSLAEYLVSLARIRSLSPTLIYGGHGEPIYDFEELFNRYVRAIDERQKNLIALLSRNGSTAWEAAKLLFPKAIGDATHRFLAISETVAHLDYAVLEGKVAVELSGAGGGAEIYRR